MRKYSQIIFSHQYRTYTQGCGALLREFQEEVEDGYNVELLRFYVGELDYERMFEISSTDTNNRTRIARMRDIHNRTDHLYYTGIPIYVDNSLSDEQIKITYRLRANLIDRNANYIKNSSTIIKLGVRTFDQ